MSSLTGHRVEGFAYDLLNLTDQVVARLDGVQPGGQLDFSVSAVIRGSGNITVTGQDIDWTQHRIRISYVLGDDVTPLITAIPKAPVEAHTGPTWNVDLELYDKLLVLSEDYVGASYGLPAGTDIIAAVQAVIASTGDTTALASEGTATLSAAMAWDATTSKLGIVNDLLDAGGFFSLWADPLGNYRATPYLLPAARPVTWEFADDANGLYLPEWTRDRDVFNVPNRYVCIARAEGDAVPYVATATDAADYAYRGRWITRTDTDVEAASNAVLDLIATRRLAEARQVSEGFEITHPVLPFGLNDAVTFTHRRLGRVVRAVCQKQTINLAPGGLVTSTLKAVA
jgi:hypothetical protein